MTEKLKLRAADAEDLAVVSSLLQDAVLPFGDMIFEPTVNRFVMVVTRFRWEDAEGPRVEGRIYERVHTGVRFEAVKAVHLMNIDQSRKSQILDLLSVKAEEGQILLIFAGGGIIRLEIDGILCHMEDIDEPWPTQWKPSHSDA